MPDDTEKTERPERESKADREAREAEAHAREQAQARRGREQDVGREARAHQAAEETAARRERHTARSILEDAPTPEVPLPQGAPPPMDAAIYAPYVCDARADGSGYSDHDWHDIGNQLKCCWCGKTRDYPTAHGNLA